MSGPASNRAPLAVIFAPAETQLSPNERDFFRDADPLGFILFARNCESPGQIRALCDDLRESLGRDCPVLIDQEGGCVRRYKGDDWPQIGLARGYGEAIRQEGATAAERLYHDMAGLATALYDSGIDVNCAPVADLACTGMSEAIGDRAYSDDRDVVVQACDQVCCAFLSNGVTPVVKHLPGHGRAVVDPHVELPLVDSDWARLQDTDFSVFQQIFAQNYTQGLWGMMAHVIYTAIDSAYPASLSHRVIGDVVRGTIGFDGFLLSDDISMGALNDYGDLATRAKMALDAGCDCALYCYGSIHEMQVLARDVPQLSAASLERFNASRQWRSRTTQSA